MARTPFLDAAERCEQFVRSIKEKQHDRTGAGAVPAEEPRPAHPEEAWARRYAGHVLRPARQEGGHPPLSRFVPLPAGVPEKPVLSAMEAPAPVRTGHIGQILGKTGPRRSWAGRLFRKS